MDFAQGEKQTKIKISEELQHDTETKRGVCSKQTVVVCSRDTSRITASVIDAGGITKRAANYCP